MTSILYFFVSINFIIIGVCVDSKIYNNVFILFSFRLRFWGLILGKLMFQLLEVMLG